MNASVVISTCYVWQCTSCSELIVFPLSVLSTHTLHDTLQLQSTDIFFRNVTLSNSEWSEHYTYCKSPCHCRWFCRQSTVTDITRNYHMKCLVNVWYSSSKTFQFMTNKGCPLTQLNIYGRLWKTMWDTQMRECVLVKWHPISMLARCLCWLVDACTCQLVQPIEERELTFLLDLCFIVSFFKALSTYQLCWWRLTANPWCWQWAMAQTSVWFIFKYGGNIGQNL